MQTDVNIEDLIEKVVRRMSDQKELSPLTVQEIFNKYMSVYARQHCKSWKNMERIFKSYLTDWALRPAESITKLEVQELHSSLGETVGKTTANRVVELLCPMYNKAIELNLIRCINPASRIQKFVLMPRERFLEQEEIQRLFAAIDTLRYDVTKDFILMCLFTAARRSNVAAMRWDQISIQQQTWRIPVTKNGTSHRLPLTGVAMAVLARREQNSKPGCPWVFPSLRSRSGHLTKPEEAWRCVKERSGLTDTRLHDLRRTLASWQALTGSNIVVIAGMLNHKELKSTAIYARLNVDAIRASMETATAKMMQQ